MSTILPHMVWPSCEFRMHVWNVLHATRWKCRTQKSPSGHHPTTLSGYIFATKALIDNWKNLLSSNIPSTCPYNMVNFGILAGRSSGWDRFVSLGHPCKFQRVSRLGSVTARHSSIGRHPNFAALNRERHIYTRQGGHHVGHWPTFLVSSCLWPPYVIGGPLYFCPVISIYLSSSSFFFLA